MATTEIYTYIHTLYLPDALPIYAGGWWDWLTPFSLLTGVALVVGYSLLGATWLVLKTEGSLQQQARRYAWVAGIATLVLIGVVSLATPFLNPAYLPRWFAWPTDRKSTRLNSSH